MYMNLIRGYLEQGNLDMAYELRDDFKTCSLRNRIEILNSVFVEHLFKQGKDEEAMELYKSSLNNKDGFTANGAVANAYLKVLLKYGKKTQAWALFQYMLDNYSNYHRSELDVDTLNMMVNECFKSGRFSDALNTFIKTKAKLKYLPVGAYKNIITRFCRNGNLSEAENVFDELLKESFTKPDVATYTSLIHAYVEAGRTEDAVQTANKMITSNLQEATKMLF
ncbi:unnamed protein product [Arabis nemorensis]|uniref:Pentacotripeptide-repeat region of PRORP domain-containing protein n=1 Tax=Arabis nemorensis TaxID=586526 RepID=A0A565BCL7_9BRAS|nr:unnamed protein product [Arabis nemorensis]